LAIGQPALSAHSWLYCRANIGYQAAIECHALAAFSPERAEPPFGAAFWLPTVK
jgi:hypothetical protein